MGKEAEKDTGRYLRVHLHNTNDIEYEKDPDRAVRVRNAILWILGIVASICLLRAAG